MRSPPQTLLVRPPVEASRLARSLTLCRAVMLVFALILVSMLSLRQSMLLRTKEFLVNSEPLKLRTDSQTTTTRPTAAVPESLGEIGSKGPMETPSDSNVSAELAPTSNLPELVNRHPQTVAKSPATNTKTQFMMSLSKAVQEQPREPRGIVLPLFNAIAALGLSLILELRATGVDLPIEIPHCDDLDSKFQEVIFNKDPLVRIYDVCNEAFKAKNDKDDPLFCETIDHCHQKFRGFDIKIISVVLSRFQEVMLMDADTLYFRSPMLLWESEQYKITGTLFFHDRIGQEFTLLTRKVRNSRPEVTILEDFLAHFDVTPFRLLPTLNRTIASSGPATEARAKPTVIPLGFEPSDVLLTSHSWNRRSGHELDSSLLLWNKNRQPRATAILASFVSMAATKHAPGYGDKELFFLACELAETNYAFSNIGVGSIGGTYRIYNERNGQKTPVLCGDAIQFLPPSAQSDQAEDKAIVEAALPLYFNGDSILTINPSDRQVLRTHPRAAYFYNGSNRERRIPLMCLMDMRILRATPQERMRISQRQHLHHLVLKWLEQKAATDNDRAENSTASLGSQSKFRSNRKK